MELELENQKALGKWTKIKGRIKGLPRWLKWTTVILLGLGVLAGILFSRPDSGNGLPMETAKVEKRGIEQSIVANGGLDSENKQEFFTPEDSTLMELSVKVGDRVRKGQVLGRLDTMELGRLNEEANAKLAQLEAELVRARANDDGLNLAHAEAAFNKAKNKLERITYLHKEGAVTVEELEAAKVEFTQAQADYKGAEIKARQGAGAKEISSVEAQVSLAKQEAAKARERLELATFVSDMDGVVLFVGAEEGNRVLEGNRILVVGSMDKLEVTANINEIDAGSLQVGQPVKITCTALPEKEFKGEVSRVAAAAISQQSSQGQSDNVHVPVTIKLLGDISGLKPGFTVDLYITTMKRQELLTVPFEALVDRQGKKLVFVVENGVAREQEVETQKGNELYDEVVSGLKNGDVVVLNPPAGFKSGQRVTAGEKND
ncbi:efflux RND transporter periplasmic adaptor subunit [Desulforamulus ruminis]|uniref:efflux RND transporter periplasmic adaptor subunit n=1 Tax=Desulforamulus ruminis TaxID=1564 RepID=UPI0023557593|nr:efflux RND transporter periplasmic adaptor subunit [Desulforamulus ruminis]